MKMSGRLDYFKCNRVYFLYLRERVFYEKEREESFDRKWTGSGNTCYLVILSRGDYNHGRTVRRR